MATYFVTGGNGFLGSHVVDRLVEEGHTVHALARDPGNLRFLRTDGVHLEPGHLDDTGALARGVRDADVVIHGAALTKAPDEKTMMHANVTGTRHVLEACLARSEPPTLLFVSSQAAAGPSPDGRPVDESSAARPISSYGRSKLRAERLLLEHAEKLPVSIVRPPAIYGPRDDAFFFLFERARSGWLPHPRSARRLSIAHVSDVVAGIRAAESGRGVYYVCDGGVHDLVDILRAIAGAVGARARIVDIPSPLFLGAVWVWEKLARIRGQLPPMTFDRARDAVARDWICSDQRARQELSYRHHWTLVEGMQQTAEWYRTEKWLPR